MNMMLGDTIENASIPAPEPASTQPPMRAGCRSGLYVQPSTFHPLDPRMFAAHIWRPRYDKGPSREYRALERDLQRRVVVEIGEPRVMIEAAPGQFINSISAAALGIVGAPDYQLPPTPYRGSPDCRIVDVQPDRKGKPKSTWSVPWQRKQTAWSDLWSGRSVAGPAIWQEKDGKRGACWGLTKAEMRCIADAINPRMPFQAYPTGCTADAFRKAVARAEASGSCQPFEDALTNLWARKRRKRRPPRRVRVEPWCDHAYGDHGDHMMVATERGLREQTAVNGVEYGRSRRKPERGLIHASYWPNGLNEWSWDRQRWIPADPDGARDWWQGDYLVLRDVAKLSIREGVVLKMRSLDPPLAVSGIARFLQIDPKAVRTSEKIGLKRLAKAREKVGELTPPPEVEHRLRSIGMVYAEWECGDLEMFWDRSRLAAPSFTTGGGDVRKISLGCPYRRDEFRRGVWRWRPEAYYPYSGDHIDPERFLRQDGGGYVQISRPLLVPIATLLTRER